MGLAVRDRKHGAFVVRNMPPTNPGSLTPQQAFDVSSYITPSRAPNTIPHSTNTNSTPSAVCEKWPAPFEMAGVGFPVSGSWLGRFFWLRRRRRISMNCVVRGWVKVLGSAFDVEFGG